MSEFIMLCSLATISCATTGLLAYESMQGVLPGSLRRNLAQFAFLGVSCVLLPRVGALAEKVEVVVVLGALVSLADFDLRFGYVPNAALIPLAILSVVHLSTGEHSFAGIFGSMLLGGVGIALHVVGEGASFGLGDVKLLGLVGSILGAGRALSVLGAAFVIGAAIALILIGSGRYARRDAIPFVPMVSLAFLWQLAAHAF